MLSFSFSYIQASAHVPGVSVVAWTHHLVTYNLIATIRTGEVQVLSALTMVLKAINLNLIGAGHTDVITYPLNGFESITFYGSGLVPSSALAIPCESYQHHHPSAARRHSFVRAYIFGPNTNPSCFLI